MKKIITLILLSLTLTSFTQTVSDYDGNIYDIITIGTQDWIAQDLRTTHYNDGLSISEFPTGQTVNWYNNTTFANYISRGTFGSYFYNWFAANQPNICPIGWHIPSSTDFQTLKNFLNSSGWPYTNNEGKALKSTSDWDDNGNGTDAFGFNAKPVGMLNATALNNPFQEGEYGVWWTKTQNTVDFATAFKLWDFSSDMFIETYQTKQFRHCLRCMRSTTLAIETNDFINEIQIYPNPIVNKLNINSKINGNYQLFSTDGKIISENIIKNGDNIFDVGNLTSGVYYLKLNFNNRNIIKKIIKI